MLERATAEPLLADVYAGIEEYYSARVTKYGATPPGVDWICVPTQELRFVQLLKLCDFSKPFSLNDLGCGYGALLAYLAKRHARATIDYLGVDLSPAMIRCARRVWRKHKQAKFALANEEGLRIADYSLASGIFNVMLDQPLNLWGQLIAKTLSQLHATSRFGFAVNFMTIPAPGEATRPGLYRISPEPWITFCEQQFGARAELLTGYGLREFTLLVRSPGSVNQRR
jgi:SAM-dependent methyltransferase